MTGFFERELRAVLCGSPEGVHAVTKTCSAFEKASAMLVVKRPFLVVRAAGSGMVGSGDLVALRGDLPSGMGGAGELRYANELVEFIRAETGDHFEIAVAAYPEAHPQAPSFERDLENFARKAKAGADLAITQYFFTADAYFHFVDRVRAMGVEIPIVPGIMPITNYTKLARFSDACGADIPRWIRKQLEAYGDDSESIQAFGTEVISNLCQRLLDGGAPGLHFYTLNQSAPTLRVLDNLAFTH